MAVGSYLSGSSVARGDPGAGALAVRPRWSREAGSRGRGPAGSRVDGAPVGGAPPVGWRARGADRLRPRRPAGSPGAIQLSALGANGTIGLDWTRDSSAARLPDLLVEQPGREPDQRPAARQRRAGLRPPRADQRHDLPLRRGGGDRSGEGKVSSEAQATPGGEWALEELGAGDFTDVVTGGRVARLPIEKRLHILLFPEGYLAGGAGRVPRPRHPQPHPAQQRRRPLGQGGVRPRPLQQAPRGVRGLDRSRAPRPPTSGRARPPSATTPPRRPRPLWAALDGMGPDAFPYPPTAAARNFTASFLLFDPARGRAGVSGHSSSCPNPTNRSLTLRCAFGVGHAHEFTHAFSEVRDEYLEDGNTRTEPGNAWSNVTGTNRCDELPWAHLLFGRGINDKSRPAGGRLRPPRARLPLRAQVPDERHPRKRQVLLHRRACSPCAPPASATSAASSPPSGSSSAAGSCPARSSRPSPPGGDLPHALFPALRLHRPRAGPPDRPLRRRGRAPGVRSLHALTARRR